MAARTRYFSFHRSSSPTIKFFSVNYGDSCTAARRHEAVLHDFDVSFSEDEDTIRLLPLTEDHFAKYQAAL
jgi:hypothetical protein